MNLDAFLRCEWGVFISNMDSCGLQLLSRQVSGPLKLSCQHFFSHLICQGSPNTFIYLFFSGKSVYQSRVLLYVNSRCRTGVVSLFSHPGQVSVIAEYELKNETVFSNAPNMHWGREGEKKAFGFIGSAFFSGEKIQYRFERRRHSSLNEPLRRTLTLSHLTGKKGKTRSSRKKWNPQRCSLI